MENRYLTDAEELGLLRDTARRFFAEGHDDTGALADIGLTGLLAPESAGGSGWLPIEASIVAEEAGRALSSTSLIATLLAGAATAALGRDDVGGVLHGKPSSAIALAGALRRDDGQTITGKLTAVGDTEPALVLVVDQQGELLVIDAPAGGEEPDPSQVVDTTRPATVVTLSDTPVNVVASDDAARILDAAALLTGADSLGALAASATLVRGHLVERYAFERPIASFQAIQHRLADLEMLETSLRALVQRAALALAEAEPRSRRMLAALRQITATRVPAAVDECIQLAGGIGFTWEWPLHHAMRRAMTNGALPQSVVARRPDLVTGGEPEPAIAAGPEAGFRARAREIIRTHRPHVAREGRTTPETPEQEHALRQWYATLFSHGLMGAAWPAEYGGDPEHQEIHDLIVTEELIRARAPRVIDQIKLSSHVIIKFGTDQQKATYLPRIRSGEDVWCQLLSEPDAGSDLAGIKARAEQRPDGSWALSGQKTWTTDGHWAQMGVALLRTSTEPKRHAGLTAFLVPMDSPGLVVQPMQTIGGTYEFNDTFLDGVVLPPDSVLGNVGEGWSVMMTGLEVERLGIGGNVVLLDMLLDDVAEVIEALRSARRLQDPLSAVQSMVGEIAADAQLAKAFVADHVDRALVNHDAEGDGSISKVLYSEAYNRIARYGAQLVTAHAPLPEAALEAGRRLTDSWLWSRSLTISGGSSEVMRNIIAKRRLRLPQG